MTFRLKLEYYGALPKDADAVQTTAALLRHAVGQKYKDGLPKTETRLWGRLEKEITDGATDLTLTLDQWTFLRDAIQAASWPVPWAQLALTLLDYADEVDRML